MKCFLFLLLFTKISRVMRLNKITMLAFAAILPFTAIANDRPENTWEVETTQAASDNEAENNALSTTQRNRLLWWLKGRPFCVDKNMRLTLL